jgi:CRISPR-associated protein (TIGR02584 family)
MSKQSNNKRIVLIATMGSSPAVLTETVWALAHDSERMEPRRVAQLAFDRTLRARG